MKRIFAGMTFDEITDARKALFATGTMFLNMNEMVAHRSEHGPLADLYNRLAAAHGISRHAQGMAPEGRGRGGGPGSSELPSPVPQGCAQTAPKGAI